MFTTPIWGQSKRNKMGCDIHAIAEYYKDGEWHRAIPLTTEDGYTTFRNEFVDGRNYQLFGILAGVRNEGMPCISEPKGMPEECSPEWRAYCNQWGIDLHSHSWIPLLELLSFDWTQGKEQTAVVKAKDYLFWRYYKKPRGHAPDETVYPYEEHKVLSEQDIEDIVSLAGASYSYKKRQELQNKFDDGEEIVSVTWSEYLSRVAEWFWLDDIPRLLRLGADHGFENVRLVFAFDN